MALDDPFMSNNITAVVQLATKAHLPVAYGWNPLAKESVLISYATLSPELFRRAAGYVDKILKGASPATLPVWPARWDSKSRRSSCCAPTRGDTVTRRHDAPTLPLPRKQGREWEGRADEGDPVSAGLVRIRGFVIGVVLAALPSWTAPADQAPTIPRIGVLTHLYDSPTDEGLREGLRELATSRARQPSAPPSPSV
jgi:hypothetical protein